MSDSEDSAVTYTAVSSPFGGLSDIGSLGVDGPPVMPEDPYAYVVAAYQAPPSPDYVLGPEYPPSPDFVPETVYPEFIPLEDKVLPAEEQPLPAALSPTANSPGYVPKLDPEEDPDEDDDEDPEEDPADYPADGGDDGDDEDESSDDDEDDDVDIEDDEEEEHLAPTDSIIVALPAVDHASSAEETEPFETDESAATPPLHPAYQVVRLLVIPTPPPSPLSPWSSPLPQISSPPLPPILSPLLVSTPLHVSSPPPFSPISLLGYRATMIRLRAEAQSASHLLPLRPPIILSYTRSDAPSSGTPPLLPISAPTSPPPLLLPSTNRREDRPEVTLPPRKRLGIALGPRYEDEMLEDMPAEPATDDTKLGRRMIEFTTRVRQDIEEIYMRLDDEQTDVSRGLELSMVLVIFTSEVNVTLLLYWSADNDNKVAGKPTARDRRRLQIAGLPQETDTVH
ncbi:hypothetical protein Tco_0634734 [Tanacetum coccineum]